MKILGNDWNTFQEMGTSRRWANIYIVVVIVIDAIFGPSFLFSSITEYVDFLEGDANHFALLDS